MSPATPSRSAVIGVLIAALLVAVVVAVVLASKDPDRLSSQGRTALDAHELARAEARFRAAIAEDPGHIDALAGLGWTYLLAGEQGAAEAAFDRCVELSPTAAECIRGQASVAMRRGDQAVGRGLLLAALAAAPDDPGVASSLALLELSDGDIEGAATRYESLVARFPDDAEYKLGLGEARLRQDRVEEALALVNEALSQADTPLRTTALLHLLRARCLVKSVTGRVDPLRCEETVPPVLAWLDAADAAVDAAEATQVKPPRLGEVRRLVGRKRGEVDDTCPAGEIRVTAPPSVDPG